MGKNQLNIIYEQWTQNLYFIIPMEQGEIIILSSIVEAYDYQTLEKKINKVL